MRIVPDNPYDAVPYTTFPMAQTHPDRLASVATLFGMSPAPVTACRVLDVGCGDGSNLIPMAYALPDSRFLGIDLAPEPVEKGRQAIRELGLSNIELAAMDLRDLAPDAGLFDYIIAHGLYSWVPDEVRSALLDLCRARLAPQGVAFISYNALPGRHVRLMFREMLLHHIRDCFTPRERIEQARAFLKMLGESRMVAAPWRPMIDDEIERLLTHNTGWLFHDDLAPVNDSFYFRDFAQRVAGHGMQYLGDAEAHLMFDPQGSLASLGGDVLEREQYLDFLYFRRLRQTLLCHAGVSLRRHAQAEQMDRFLFSSPAKAGPDGQVEGLNSVRITAAHEVAGRVAGAMGEIYPLPAAFEDLLPYAGDREILREILFALISSGFAEFHVFDFPCQEDVTAKPRATRLARWQAARGDYITVTGHGAVQLDTVSRALVGLLDGSRDVDRIAAELAHVPGAPELEEIRELLPQRLEWFARMGLLEG